MKPGFIYPMKDGDIERFWSCVEKGPGCWEWKGPKSDSHGFKYGVFTVMGVRGVTPRYKMQYKAHRVAWTITNNRQVPEGLTIDHVCQNKLCMNPSPEHMEPVSQSVNSQRAQVGRKGLCRKGHGELKNSRCNVCNRARQAEWRAKNPERWLAIQAKARSKPKALASQAARDTAWRVKHDVLIEKRDTEGYKRQWKNG